MKKKRRKRAKTVTIPDPRSVQLAHLRVPGLLLVLLLLPSFSLRESQLSAQRPRDEDKPYALIAGTAWGPDDRPVSGVPVKIRRATDKKPKWEVYSDHHGESAQSVSAGKSAYIPTADLKHFKPADGQTLHLVQDVTVHV